MLVAYAPVLQGGFVVLDDSYNLTANAAFRGFGSEHLRWMFTTNLMGNYQPLTWLSYALDYSLWGLDGPRFHQASVLWHLLVAVSFFFVGERLLGWRSTQRDRGSAQDRRLAALFATLLFAVHPLRGESVAWASGRNDVVSGLFTLLCVLAWMRYVPAGAREVPRPRILATSALAAGTGAGLVMAALVLEQDALLALGPQGALLLALGAALLLTAVVLAPRGAGLPSSARGAHVAYVLAWAGMLLSLLGKSQAVALPLVLLVLDAWPFGRFAQAATGRARRLALLVLEKLPFFALSLLAARVAGWAKQAGDLRSLGEHGVFERCLQAAYGLVWYPRKTLLPTELSAMVDLPAELSLTEPRFLFSLLAGLGITALVVAHRRRFPAALVIWITYALLVGPVLGFLQAGAQLVADRYSYLPCMPLALGAAALLLFFLERGPHLALAARSVAGAGVLVYAFATPSAAGLWGDSIRLLEHGIASTGSPRLMTNLAMAYNEAGAQNPGAREALLGVALQWSQLAVEESRARDLEVPRYRLHRGTILLNLGRLEEAAEDLRWFVQQEPRHAEGHLNLGWVLSRMERPAEALESFRHCTELRPDAAAGWRGLGLACEATGERERAMESYRRALALEPRNAWVRERLQALGAH